MSPSRPLLLTWALLLVASVLAEVPNVQGMHSYADWVAACRRLPTNRRSGGNPSAPATLPLPRFSDFRIVLDAFMASCRTGAMSDSGRWMGKAGTTGGFLDPETMYFMAPGAPAMAFVRPFLAGPPQPQIGRAHV